MACCAAIALVFGLIRWGWRWITLRGGTPPALEMPPQAWRPAPSASPKPASAPAPQPRGGPTRERFVCGLRFIAGGAALYAGAVALLLAAGAAQHEATPSVGWFERGVFIVALATLALVAAAMLERPRHTLVARDVLACSLSGMGAAWLVLGIVDQHAFGLYVIAQGSIAWDVIFHGAGEVAIALGVLTMRVPGPVGRRSQTAVALTSR